MGDMSKKTTAELERIVRTTDPRWLHPGWQEHAAAQVELDRRALAESAAQLAEIDMLRRELLADPTVRIGASVLRDYNEAKRVQTEALERDLQEERAARTPRGWTEAGGPTDE